MSRAKALEQEIARQFRVIGRSAPPDPDELRAIVRAVRLTLAEPSSEMLAAGWGSHFNLRSELGVAFARDDYERMLDAAFAPSLNGAAASPEAACDPERSGSTLS